MSNLLRDHVGLKDPLTEFLAADPNDGEIAGRFKNAIEGLFLGAATEGLFNAFRMYRSGLIAKTAGGTPEAVDAAMAAEQAAIRTEQRNLLKAAFNLTDEEADVTNTLIDRMGLDRSKLKIATGQQAEEAYTQAGGAALEQRIGTDTPQFKNWFKASKVVDDAGNPVVVYHGTGQIFSKFVSKSGMYFFSPNADFAGMYPFNLPRNADRRNIIPVYLSIQNPFIAQSDDGFKLIGEFLSSETASRRFKSSGMFGDLTQAAADRGLTPQEYMAQGEWMYLEHPDFLKFIKSKGHDGMRVGEAGVDNWVVFKPTQIKSQFNRGTFSTRRADILKQDMGTEVRGFAAFAEDGKAIIGGLKNPNVSTAIEEITHVARRQLFDTTLPAEARMGISNADIDTVGKWAGAEGNRWSVDAEEKFAKGFMKYLRDGSAPDGLAGIFEKMADWMRNLYRDIKGSELDLEISPEVKDVFDKLITRGPGYENAVSAAVSGVSVGARVLTQAATSPGLGKPGGLPDKPINLERFSSVDDVNRAAKEAIEQEPLKSNLAAATPEELDQVVRESQAAYEEISRMSGETQGIDFKKAMDSGTMSMYDLSRASRQLQGIRKFAASAQMRLMELSAKGSAATPDDMYEFLVGNTVYQQVVVTIKERQREVARMLGAMRINPVPEKISFLAPLPKAGELMPPPASAAPSPAAVAPPPGAATPTPGAAVPPPGTAAPSGAGAVPPPAAGTGAAPTNPLADPALRSEVVRQEIERHGGLERVRATMARFHAAGLSGGPEAVAKMARETRYGGALVEYWMNSILSGPTTHFVNMSSNLLTALYLPLERALGATLRGDFGAAGQSLKRYIYGFNQSIEAVRMAWMATKMDANILDTVGTSERDLLGRAIQAKSFGMSDGSIPGMATNFVGKIFNLPSRLLASEDEFFKQLNYRANFLSELHIEGMKRFNGDARQAAQWAKDTFDRAISDGQMYAESVILKRAYAEADKAVQAGAIKEAQKADFVGKYMADTNNWDPSLGVLSKRAMSETRMATFSTPLTTGADEPLTTRFSARIQMAATEHPFIRFALPFIRTPTNLLNFALDRTLPISLLNLRKAFKEVSEQAISRDPNIRNDAVGRLAFASAITLTVGAAAAAGVITGGGPKSKTERDLKTQTGWQPYSIKIGNTYYSYRRNDPFASIIGVVADTMEAFQNNDQKGQGFIDSSVNAIVVAIARNITNKTYLTGITNISNAISNPEQFGKTLVNQYVGSLSPFSGLTSQSISTIADDPVIRDVQTMTDAIRAKIPFLAEKVAPRRNMFGEPITKPAAIGPDMVSPYVYTEVKDDLVLKEMDMLGHGFTPPKPKRGAVDLTEFQTKTGQGAYDRWLELHGQVKIGGRTLKEAMAREIKSKAYQKLTPVTNQDYESPRIRQLRQIVSEYREAAFRQLLKESPELKTAMRIDFANKRALRMGRSAQELLDLGNR